MKIKKNLKFVILFFVAVVFVTEFLFVFVLPFWVNRLFENGSVVSAIKSKTGMTLSYESAKIRTYPDFSLKFSVKKPFLSDAGRGDVLNADYISAKISLLPAVFGNINLRNAVIENLYVKLIRDKDSHLRLGSYRLKPADLRLKRLSGAVLDSKVEFVDEKLKKNTTLCLEDVKIKDYREGKYVFLSMKAYIDADGGRMGLDAAVNTKLPVLKNTARKDFRIKGAVKNFDAAYFKPYAAELLKKDLLTLDGKIEADFDIEKNVRVNAKLENFSFITKKPGESVILSGKTTADFTGGFKQNSLIIDKLAISAPQWQAVISGLIKDITGKNPGFDLKADLPSSDVHCLIAMLPPAPNTNHAVEKLKKYGVWGTITASLNLKGSSKSPLLYGKAELVDLHILKEKPIVAPCSMNLEFTGKQVNLYTKVFADMKKQQYVVIEGFSELKPFGAGEIKIKSTDSVNLKTAHYMLVPIHDIVGFDLGPLPYMSISGYGNIDLLTRGTVFDGEASGGFRFKDTTAMLKGLKTSIENAGGYLDFNGKDMTFVMDKAQIKGCPVTVKGTANLDGKIDFNIHSPAIFTDELVSIVNNSLLLNSKKLYTEKIQKASGKASVDIELKGVVKNFSDLKDVSDLDFSGLAILKNNSVSIENIPEIKAVNGKIKFDNKDVSADIESSIFDSKFILKAYFDNNEKASVEMHSPALKLDEVFSYAMSTVSRRADIPKTGALLNFKASYSGNPYKINPENINAKGYLVPQKRNSNDDVFIKSGEFSLKKNTFRLKNFDTAIFNTSAHADAVIHGVLGANPKVNGNLTLVNFDISNFNKIRNVKMLPAGIKKALLAYENYDGRADVRLSCESNKVSGEIRLLGLKFLQSAYKIPITIDSGNIFINNNKITLKSINANFDNVPIFINAYINGFSGNPEMKGYLTTKVTESFVNKYINEHLSYPVKPKGDITLTAEVSGTPEKYNADIKLRLEKEADIYYMGANLDDTEEEREVNANLSVHKNVIKINSLDYLRFMTSQNDYVYPRRIINVHGGLKYGKDKIFFNNLHILTENNANVKLFNVLFKKSVLKKGMFNCNLVLNGDSEAPVVTGKAGMLELDMPLYTTLIKDVSMQFTPSVVNLSMNGMSYGSDFVLKTVIKNRPSLPVVIDNLKISSKSVELDHILDSLTQVTLSSGIKLDDETESLQDTKKQSDMLSNAIIKNGLITADTMKVRGLPAKNFKAGFKLDKDLILRVENLAFDVAEGAVQGKAKYDFKTGKVSAEIMAKHVDANKIATAVFEAKDQIFGYLNGSMFFTTRGNTEEERLSNVSGTVYFEINDGKMPKLGSVEYLLKASSLFKSGLTGVSINNFIDLIAPVKTGYFNSIKGLLLISRGKAKNVEIFSSGENLSMYIKGTYDIPESFADLNVYGRLTKKADNILGPVGNMSFNSLLNLIPGFKLDRREKTAIIKELNKIPGVEFNDMQYRIFNAKIHGDINSDKYVKYFKWIE